MTPFALILAFVAAVLVDGRPVEEAADPERRSSEIELQRGLRER